MSNEDSFSLDQFVTYDATKPDQIIDSTHPDSARKWARKAAFLQLGYALEMHRMDHSVSPEQSQAIDDFNALAFGEEFKGRNTEPRDIEAALKVLDILGIDTKKQRAQLTSWQKTA